MLLITLNLARAPERLANMRRQFEIFGLSFTRLEATDGRALTEADRAMMDDDARRHISVHPLSDNEIGCWLSHRRAMRALLDSGAPMAAILEDDSALDAAFPDVIAAIEKLDTAFDVIDLHRNFKRGEIFTPCRPLIPGNRLGRVGYTHMHATAYAISRAGAEKFLAHSQRFAHAVDKEMHRYWANGLDYYALEKPVAEQRDGGHSYIDETRKQDRPDDRPRYPDADAFRWRTARFLTKAADSIMKRAAFALRRCRDAGRYGATH